MTDQKLQIVVRNLPQCTATRVMAEIICVCVCSFKFSTIYVYCKCSISMFCIIWQTSVVCVAVCELRSFIPNRYSCESMFPNFEFILKSCVPCFTAGHGKLARNLYWQQSFICFLHLLIILLDKNMCRLWRSPRVNNGKSLSGQLCFGFVALIHKQTTFFFPVVFYSTCFISSVQSSYEAAQRYAANMCSFVLLTTRTIPF